MTTQPPDPTSIPAGRPRGRPPAARSSPSANALRHGILSTSPGIPEIEERADWEALLAGPIAATPSGPPSTTSTSSRFSAEALTATRHGSTASSPPSPPSISSGTKPTSTACPSRTCTSSKPSKPAAAATQRPSPVSKSTDPMVFRDSQNYQTQTQKMQGN